MKKHFIGIYIFSILLILSSIDQMIMLVYKKNWYFGYYHYYPLWYVTLRYVFSWAQRVVGISCGIGLLLRYDLFRKLAFIIGVITICGGYFKHPIEGFVNHIHELDRMGVKFHTLHMDDPVMVEQMAIFGSFMSWFFDLLFWGSFIFYFTRPKVKEQFKLIKLKFLPLKV